MMVGYGEMEAKMDNSKRLVELKQNIFLLCGRAFDLEDSKQLQEVLYVDRDLPTGPKTRTGFSVSDKTLEWLSERTHDPLPALVLAYRRTKLWLRYDEVEVEGYHLGFLEYVLTKNGRRYSIEIEGIEWACSDDLLKILPIYDLLMQHPLMVLPLVQRTQENSK